MIAASLVFQDKVSNKFWSLETNKKSFTTTWGRIGTVGCTNTKTFINEYKCEQAAKKLIASKIKKGYVQAITKELILELFITILSGIAEKKNDKEFYYRDDKFGKLATIEFVNMSSDHIILRHYYENGNIKSEHEWLNGKQDGIDRGWKTDGQKRWERRFVQGKIIEETRYP